MPSRALKKRLTFPKLVQYTGLGIAIFETVYEKADRPSLLILAAGMMGLDSILKAQSGSHKE